MDTATSIALGRQVLMVALTIAAPVLCIGLLVGILLALFQALTSLQEQTLTMVPKILAIGTALFVLLPFILSQLVDFTRGVLSNLTRLGAGP